MCRTAAPGSAFQSPWSLRAVSFGITLEVRRAVLAASGGRCRRPEVEQEAGEGFMSSLMITRMKRNKLGPR